jgi:Fe2+ or Zn2+ uptake regulation protein
MPHNQLDYKETIRSAGHRMTHQRQIILDAVCEGGGHTTLGAIYARARRVDPSIDRSTVYRALHLFIVLGLVVSADIRTGETYYEIVRPEPHHHLICERCGSLTEIGNDTVQLLCELIGRRHGFAAHVDHLVLAGLCARCQDARTGDAPTG